MSEKEKQDEGCEWCDGNARIIGDATSSILEAKIICGHLYVYYRDGKESARDYKHINFCPMCGRQLGKEQHD